MPLYDFQCKECLHLWEEIRGVMEAAKGVDCPNCGKEKSAVITVSPIGGYRINGDNSASVRPKQAGAFKKRS